MGKQPAGFKLKLFAWATWILGGAALVYSVYRLDMQPIQLDWLLILIGLVLVTWRAEIWIPGIGSKITLSDTFIFICVLMLGPWAAAVLASIDALARSPRGSKNRRVTTI